MLSFVLTLILSSHSTASAEILFNPVTLTPKMCAKALDGLAVVQGQTIRGKIVERIQRKMTSLLESKQEHFKVAGLRFGEEEVALAADNAYVYLGKLSFTDITDFFSQLMLVDVREDHVRALEAAFMVDIGAVVYGDTAKQLQKIYQTHLAANKHAEIPTGIEFMVYEDKSGPVTVANLMNATSVGLKAFLDVVDSASDYDQTPGVKSWSVKAHKFLSDSKSRS